MFLSWFSIKHLNIQYNDKPVPCLNILLAQTKLQNIQYNDKPVPCLNILLAQIKVQNLYNKHVCTFK
jgi:hypothetical protein